MSDQSDTTPSSAEPFGYVFQHEETGLIRVVDVQQVEWGFEKNNPRLQKIGPVYLHPPAVLDEPARVGNAVFRKGVAVSAVITAAQRCYAHMQDTPPPSTPMRQGLETGEAKPGNASETAGAPAPPPSSHTTGIAERCAERFDRIASIIDRNLYHQREKVEDAKSIAISMREELRADNSTGATHAMVSALEWYAENARLCRLIHSEGDAGRHALSDDGGKRATAALAAVPPQTNVEGQDNG